MPLCPCCSQRISEATYSMDVDLSRITNKIGLGTVTLFQHLKVYIYMTVAIFVLYGIPNLITNFLGEYCGKSATTPTAIRCRNDFITATSFLNKIGEDLYVDIQGFSGIVTTATLLVIYYYQRFTLRFCYSEVMISNLKSVKLSAKSSDFTLMAKHLPPERYTVQELEQQLHHYYDEVYKSSLNRPVMSITKTRHWNCTRSWRMTWWSTRRTNTRWSWTAKSSTRSPTIRNRRGMPTPIPKVLLIVCITGHDRTSHTKAQTLYDQSSLRHHGLQKIIDLGTYGKSSSIAFVSFKLLSCMSNTTIYLKKKPSSSRNTNIPLLKDSWISWGCGVVLPRKNSYRSTERPSRWWKLLSPVMWFGAIVVRHHTFAPLRSS